MRQYRMSKPKETKKGRILVISIITLLSQVLLSLYSNVSHSTALSTCVKTPMLMGHMRTYSVL